MRVCLCASTRRWSVVMRYSCLNYSLPGSAPLPFPLKLRRRFPLCENSIRIHEKQGRIDSYTVRKITQYLLLSPGVCNFVRNSGSTVALLHLSQLKHRQALSPLLFKFLYSGHRINGFSDFVHSPDSKQIEDKITTFRKLDLFPPWREGTHILCWVP
jgi:hypothetical protein